MALALRLLCLVLLTLSWVGAEAPSIPTHKVLRCLRDRTSQLETFQSAVTRFRHPTSGYRVDLVSVVHVGPASYYKRLNQQLRSYDAVLYELVADASQGRPVPLPGEERGDNPLSLVQSGLSNLLGLDFQLDHLDYSPNNFVHADISPEEFQRSMDKRGESFMQILLNSLQKGDVDSPEAEKELAQVNLFAALSGNPGPKDRMHLRRGMALLFSNPDQISELLEGPGGGTLLSVRNQKALGVMRQQLKTGKKRLAIFYGAAHMKDLEQRLVRDFGMRFVDQIWLPAWDLRLPTR